MVASAEHHSGPGVKFTTSLRARYADDMTAVIFHFWLGVILLAVSILAVVGLIGGYLKKVTAPQFPSKRNREE
jgi:hypothetical protein